MAYPSYLKDQPSLLILQEGMKNPFFHIKRSTSQIQLTFDKKAQDVSILIPSSWLNSSIRFPKNADVNVTLVLFDDRNVEASLELILAEFAQVRLHLVHLSKPGKTIVRSLSVKMESSSLLELNKGVFAKGSIQENEQFHLLGLKAKFIYNTLYVGSIGDQYAITQTVTHEAKDTDSKIENSLVSSSDAKLEFLVNGKILSGMSKSKCFQQNRGVILSETGQIRVDPKLYIDEFDVEAGHGAAIGQINEEELFYLLSRGIDLLEAKQLVLSGYTEPFLSKITNEDLNKALSKQITKKIKGVR